MIRKANRQDASRLAEILIFAKRTAYRSIFQNDEVSFNEMQVLDLALEFRDGKGTLKDLYVYDDGIVKGLIHWNIQDEGRKIGQVEELYVDPFFQREGIGKALLNDCKIQSAGAGCQSISLWVLEENHNARTFYEKQNLHHSGNQKLESRTTAVLLEYVGAL